MSKPMKCRGWHNERKVMIPWEQMKFQKDEDEDEICFYEDEDGGGVSWAGGADIEIMQYTGLKDRKNNEIYEGDLILVEGELIARVFWSEDLVCFLVDLGVNQHESLPDYIDGEVISNIYIDPEVRGSVYE